jgi:hypothetical protein
MRAIENANVKENTYYEISIASPTYGTHTMRGMFFFVDVDANKVGIIPAWNTNILLNYDADWIVSVDGVDGDTKGD